MALFGTHLSEYPYIVHPTRYRYHTESILIDTDIQCPMPIQLNADIVQVTQGINSRGINLSYIITATPRDIRSAYF